MMSLFTFSNNKTVIYMQRFAVPPLPHLPLFTFNSILFQSVSICLSNVSRLARNVILVIFYSFISLFLWAYHFIASISMCSVSDVLRNFRSFAVSSKCSCKIPKIFVQIAIYLLIKGPKIFIKVWVVIYQLLKGQDLRKWPSFLQSMSSHLGSQENLKYFVGQLGVQVNGCLHGCIGNFSC